MWKIFLISVGFCIFLPLQVEACSLAFFDSLPTTVRKALRAAGVHTIEDISLFSERGLRHILPTQNRQNGMEKIRAIFSNRGESLARDFLVDDVGLSFTAANILNRAGIHTEENLRRLTERKLRDIFQKNKKIRIKEAVEKVKAYLSNRGEFLALESGLVIEDIGISARSVKALKEAGIHTIEDLHQLTRRNLYALFSKEKLGAFLYVQKIESYLLARGETLARDFFVDDIGLTVEVTNVLIEVNIRTEGDLLKWTESGLLALPGIGSLAVEKIKIYLSKQGKSLARDFFVDDIGLSIKSASALKVAEVHTVESLQTLSEQELRQVLLRGHKKLGGLRIKEAVAKVKAYLSNRGEFLALKSGLVIRGYRD